ncbi:3-isopropylmalate dehydratase large subunit [Candidatus Atribacteria bacterium RBG_19FT_COMBO_35_14]|uniref:3-isopropylmalate dehydratase large subunit n=1 Tax=Candidatus Sediminicultor quintus TaxID=1797291 RepID=A0A1F5A9D0_9BACT|nr:MAG: 3-isopropylmalate dehydratase large subunit [Candidatus Atribacteria bacterium RBG_19FT_COMBO_35_14]
MHPLYQILADAAGRDKVTPGEFIIAKVDLAEINDLYLQVIMSFKEMGGDKIWDSQKVTFVMDHYAPPPTIKAAENQTKMREFAKEQGIKYFFDINRGVCHQVMPEEGLVWPDMVLVATDSHTTTHGAFGAFSTGIGATDMAAVLLTGEIWFRVPEIIKIKIQGKIRKGVMAKDIILYIISQLGTDIALYKAVEYTGETVTDMSLDERLVLCNMAVEMGAKATYIKPDKKVWDYISLVNPQKIQECRPIKQINEKENEVYESVYNFDISNLEPQVALPYRVDNVVPVSQVAEEPINQALIGTCTGGRINDIKIAAQILKGRKIFSSVRLLIIPVSNKILEKCIELGYIQTLLNAGATLVTPSCGPCLGAHEGVLSSGESCISTSSRNFPGRMGSSEAKIFLSSPATAAASAIKGVITDPREFL